MPRVGLPRAGCPGVPRAGCPVCPGLSRAGCPGVPRAGCPGVSRARCPGVPRAGCPVCPGVPRAGCPGVSRAGCPVYPGQGVPGCPGQGVPVCPELPGAGCPGRVPAAPGCASAGLVPRVFVLTRLRRAEAASGHTFPSCPGCRRGCATAVSRSRSAMGLPLVPLLPLLLLPALLPARCCEPPEGSAGAVRALSARLLGLAGDPTRDPDPAVYLALRLARQHDPGLEQRYLERLQDTFQRPFGRSLQGHGRSRWDAEHSRSAAEPPQTGRLALYLLGLQAACPPLGPHRSLVTWLKYYLEEDWTGSRQQGHPITSYYQYGLGVLALCVHHKRVREEVVRRLLTAQHRGKLGHGGNSVDTEAVLALAFTCLERRRLVGTELAAELRVAAHEASRNMAKAQGPDGIIGNIYSTPWALQVFLATGECRTEPAFGQAMAALLEKLEAFGSAATMAQALPVLHGRSYLDIASMGCGEEPDTLTPLDVEPLAEVPGNKKVQLVVECPLPWCYDLKLYDRLVPVPAAASLLDVLQAAAALDPRDFRFHTQDTPQGPFLTEVLGLEARQEKRNYWQILTAPNTPLQMGIADYRPQDGETLILRLSEW